MALILINSILVIFFAARLFYRWNRPVGDYHVYIDHRLVKIVRTESEAWDVIRKAHWGSLWTVTNKEGKIRGEFIPF